MSGQDEGMIHIRGLSQFVLLLLFHSHIQHHDDENKQHHDSACIDDDLQRSDKGAPRIKKIIEIASRETMRNRQRMNGIPSPDGQGR